jgi:amidase
LEAVFLFCPSQTRRCSRYGQIGPIRFSRCYRFLKYGVWLTPTLSEPPLPLGSFDTPPDQPQQTLLRVMTFMPFTWICNFTGQPAMSVPLYWNGEGLPIGTHFVGRFGDEATLFRLGAQLEAARPWAARQPPVCA